jgi:hypothetical protein
MKNFKWGTESFNSKPIYVVLFVSRNKDNAEIEGFVERRTSFITHKSVSELQTEFSDFVSHGKPGEFCRMYYSVNPRDPVKIHKQLLHFLIDEPDFNLCCMNSKLAGIAASKECNAGKSWMFDFDIPDKKQLWDFIDDIVKIDATINISAHPTPHGYAVITDRGFDTRKLFEKWTENVTLKRDDLLCVAWDITDKPDY